MPHYLYRSIGPSKASAITTQADGGNLPAALGPWERAGTAMPVKHGNAELLAQIDQDGYCVLRDHD